MSWKSIQHIYETLEILRSMIFSTVSCLQSDNGVSTSNTVYPPRGFEASTCGLAQPAPGPAGDIFKLISQSPTRSGRFQSHVTPARPGQRVSNITGRLPGLAREIPRIFSLFLRAVYPPRGFEASTCSLARAPRLLWGVARSIQAAYEAESAMPLYRLSNTVGAAWVT